MDLSFSDYEIGLVTDARVLLTKNEIIRKVSQFFGGIAEAYKEEISKKDISFKHLINPKISKGENYLGLPYIMLDFPREFGKSDIFAIRSFFWWGNFFSITLHLSGSYLRQNLPGVKSAINKKIFSDWFIAIGKSQWDHHFEKDNYMPVDNFDLSNATFSYFKMAKKIPLSEWDKIDTFFLENFSLLINTLADQAPIL